MGNEYKSSTGWTVSGTGTIGDKLYCCEPVHLVSQWQRQSRLIWPLASRVAPTRSMPPSSPTTTVSPALSSIVLDDLSSSQTFGGCCGLVTIAGITGLSL